jgi:hypothetical protein
MRYSQLKTQLKHEGSSNPFVLTGAFQSNKYLAKPSAERVGRLVSSGEENTAASTVTAARQKNSTARQDSRISV